MENKSISIKECFANGTKPELGYDYLLQIDEATYLVDHHITSGKKLLELCGKKPEEFLLFLKEKGGKRLINPKDSINLIEDGIEQFSTLSKNIEDLEECFKKGVLPEKGCRYRIKINKELKIVDQQTMNGREILDLVGKTPENTILRQKTKNGRDVISPDEIVDFSKKGIERFITQDRSCTEGFIQRLEFDLPEEDRKFLSSLGNKWETIKEEGRNWLIIRDYPIPTGFNHEVADVAILITPQYPIGALDMIWFHPEVLRADGKPIGALAKQTIEGKVYQRWSRHRTGHNPWVPGEDNVESHIYLMIENLKLEFKKR